MIFSCIFPILSLAFARPERVGPLRQRCFAECERDHRVLELIVGDEELRLVQALEDPFVCV